jgi:branched-chain amino acid transport system substrate-binding protein
MGLSRVAILYIKNDYSQGLSMDFKSQFEADGGTIVGMETGLQGDKDFKTQLTKIKALNPEALFIPNYVAEIAQILEQAKQLGLNTKMLSADGFSNPEILELAGDLANGVIFSGPEKEDPAQANAKTAAFEKKYEEKWGEKPDSFSLNAYDGANLIMDAIQAAYDKASDADKKALNLDRSLMQKYVAGIKGYMGVSGEITFAPNGDVIKNQGILTAENRQYKQIGVYRIESGKLVKVK